MKTDQYLNLCVEQAKKSPLHYRHGCIIVRGGKVIGQGYNDYRPGFNGGALKNGRVANGGLDGPAIAELREKLKKQKHTAKQQQLEQQEPTKTFIPFEGTGGGNHVNGPLSMHSEMMAIYSALSTSSTLSSTTFSYEKPCFKLPRSDKRKARLRKEALASYVNTVCATSQRSGKSQVVSNHGNNNNNNNRLEEDKEDKELEESTWLKQPSPAFHEVLSGEKHRRHKKNEKKNQNDGYQYRYQYGRYGQQIQQHVPQQRLALENGNENLIRGYDSMTQHENEATTSTSAASKFDTHRTNHKQSNMTKIPRDNEATQSEPLLLPKGHTGNTAKSVAERQKHSRLNGADLYVTRVGWCKDTVPVQGKERTPPSKTPTANTDTDGIDSLGSSLASLTATSSTTSSGSLHDELINRDPSPSPSTKHTLIDSLVGSIVRASRPCYRCITFMHSVGIKRVFWTNDAGEWEGGKVRDLVDALDSSMEDVANGGKGGPMGNGVFVTKHEVLMLKRKMGESGK